MHRKYVRAAVTGLSLATILLSAAACALEVRYAVSHQALLRYFTRPHLAREDLGSVLQHPLTAIRLGSLLGQGLLPHSGGFVYAEENGLAFHPLPAPDPRAAIWQARAEADLYPRLARAYFAADLDGLLIALDTAGARRRLAEAGVAPLVLARLQGRAKRTLESSERHRILRRVGLLVRHFIPEPKPRFELSLADKLRFYQDHAPAGEFVGLFEVVGVPIRAPVQDGWARDRAAHSHYLLISPHPEAGFRLDDYYRGRKIARYRIRPVPHPSGLDLHRIEPAGSRQPTT